VKHYMNSCYTGSYQRGHRNFRGSQKQHSISNAHVRSEIKDMDQIWKERQKKVNTTSYIKSKWTKVKKFGKNGKKRKGK